MQPTVDERTAECARWATVPLPVSHSGCAVRYLLALLRRVDACARAAALRCTVSARHSLTHSLTHSLSTRSAPRQGIGESLQRFAVAETNGTHQTVREQPRRLVRRTMNSECIAACHTHAGQSRMNDAP